MQIRLVLYGLLAVTLVQGCSKPQTPEQGPASSEPLPTTTSTDSNQPGRDQAADWKPEHIDDERLHNAYWLNRQVISGGVPEEPSMQALKELGVQTIISVDGAQPDVELAKQYGMRYVHLPHGYDGIPKQRALELAKAVQELDGPVYVHCHHGKHRSPAAAAAACVVAGMISPAQGVAVLKTAGTSEGYRGLYQSVRESTAAGRETLASLNVEFREQVPVTPMADAMVALEKTHDHLNQIAKNGWRPLEKRPELDPAHEALLLQEHFTEMLRTDDVKKRPAEFQRLLKESEDAATVLMNKLAGSQSANRPAEDVEAIEGSLAAVTRNCKACHQQFRDTPLQEK